MPNVVLRIILACTLLFNANPAFARRGCPPWGCGEGEKAVLEIVTYCLIALLAVFAIWKIRRILIHLIILGTMLTFIGDARGQFAGFLAIIFFGVLAHGLVIIAGTLNKEKE